MSSPDGANLSRPEPPPLPVDGAAMWDLVIADAESLPREAFPSRDLAVGDMRERDAAGRAKYGVPLQAGNGRNALVDAYQEALDLCVYLKQSLTERYDGVVWGLYRSALTLAVDLRDALQRRGRR